MSDYKLVRKSNDKEFTIIEIGNIKIGGDNPVVIIAGPCSVENEQQLLNTAKGVLDSGASILRGGAFKPRTSPYDFQGLGEDGLKILSKAKTLYGIPIITEVLSEFDVYTIAKYADIIQVGARNMQNFALLKLLGKINKPILLKRGMSATIHEWLCAAEYIAVHGNNNIILCERGVRSFETATRNTLDISAVAVVKELTHLPIVVDPSHASGKREYILPLARAAVAAGADGLIIEVHNDPDLALCDGPQSITLEQFENLTKNLKENNLSLKNH